MGAIALITLFSALAGADRPVEPGLLRPRQSPRRSLAAPSFTVVPPGPVTDRARVEMRLAIPNPTTQAHTYRAAFYLDRAHPNRLLKSQSLRVPAGGVGLATCWCATTGHAGPHRLLYRLAGPSGTVGGSWPLRVIPSGTRALPRLQGAWIEPVAALTGLEARGREAIEREIRGSVDAMHRLGMDILIITYVEYGGTFFYPSRLEFYDREVGRLSRGADCPVDVVGLTLAQADRCGMHVFLGLGRSGDPMLLWEFDQPGWAERNAAAIRTATAIAEELWDRYGHHRSLYGWYLTHEMNDLRRASGYYDPVADFCHALSPDRPVMVAPAGTPLVDGQVLRQSRVDVFAYQDAVGAGYVPYRYTYDPERRIAALDSIFSQYRRWHEGSGKHLWADLEVWEMDGSHGYAQAYPARFSRVRRQMAIEARYADVLTGYAYHGFLAHPGSARREEDPRAARLYDEYAAYLAGRSRGFQR